jgi:hypothetical protein
MFPVAMVVIVLQGLAARRELVLPISLRDLVVRVLPGVAVVTVALHGMRAMGAAEVGALAVEGRDLDLGRGKRRRSASEGGNPKAVDSFHDSLDTTSSNNCIIVRIESTGATCHQATPRTSNINTNPLMLLTV